MFEKILKNIPISVNAQLGDPFQDNQRDNTFSKLDSLEKSKYEGAVSIITKSCLTDEDIVRLAAYKLNLFVFISITGLNENKHCSLNDMLESYLKLCSVIKQTYIFIRPIIPSKNDRIEVIEPIIAAASKGSEMIIVRGFKDVESGVFDKTVLNENIYTEICDCAAKYNVKIYSKTSYAVAERVENHFLNMGVSKLGIQLLIKLGYPFDENGNVTKEYAFTKGDACFIHMVAGIQSIKYQNPVSAILSIKPNNLDLDCSSSWFGWARRTPCKINCWYCISKWDSSGFDNVGCNPLKIL